MASVLAGGILNRWTSSEVQRLALESINRKEDHSPQGGGVGMVQSIEGLNGTKRERKDRFSVELGHPSSALEHQHFWFSGLQTPTRVHTLAAPRPMFPGPSLSWNRITGFPRSLACRWQMVGLLSLHNPVSQSLILNLFLYILLALFL